MTEVIAFHHAQGLTDGVRAFADELRGAGHVVHGPSLLVRPAQSRPFSEDGTLGA